MRISKLLCIVFFIPILSGCEKNSLKVLPSYSVSEIVGKWSVVDDNGKNQITNLRRVYTFHTDFGMTVSCAYGSDNCKADGFFYKSDGNFSLENNVLTITYLKDNKDAVTEKWQIKNIGGDILEVLSSSEGNTAEGGTVLKMEKSDSDYSASIIGLWEGVSVEGESEYGDANHRWGYLDNSSYVYYSKDRYRWVPSPNVSNKFYVDGNWLVTTWKDNKGNSFYESWDIEVCDETQMVWTAFRNMPDGTSYTTKFVLKRIQGENPEPKNVVGTYLRSEDFGSIDELESLAEMYSANGITEVYYLCKGALGMTNYNKTEFSNAPHFSATDYLQRVIDVMHSHCISVYAWIYFGEDIAYLSRRPESGSFHFYYGPSNQYVDLQNEDYQEYCCDIIKEIGKNYDIDGFMIDHVRFSGAYFGWSEKDYHRLTSDYNLTLDEYNDLVILLAKTYGYDISKDESGRYVHDSENPELTFTADYYSLFHASNIGNKSAKAFENMRVDCIDNLALRLYENRGGKTMILSCMPEVCSPTSEAALNYGVVCNGKYIFDNISPKLFSADFGENSSWIKKSYNYIAGLGYNTVPSLQAYKPTSGRALQADIEAIAQAGCRHYILFCSYRYDISKAYEKPGETVVTYSKGTSSSCGTITIEFDDVRNVDSIILGDKFAGQSYNISTIYNTVTVNADCLSRIGDCGTVTLKSSGPEIKVKSVKSNETVVWFTH